MGGFNKPFWLAIALSLSVGNARLFPENRIPETIVRIALLEKVPSFNLGSENDYFLVDLKTGNKKILSPDNIVLVKPADRGVAFGEDEFNGLVRVIPKKDGQFLRLNGKRYRDTLLIKKDSKNTITVINELGLNGYLYGILPREVSPAWPKESLKAQAVVSRTYALKSLGRHGDEGFDLCNKVHCQVYGGFDAEKEETNRAVDETQNEVIIYDDQLASTYFFANCGGRTEDPVNSWESAGAPPYLKPTRCRTCKNQSHYKWETTVQEKEVFNALSKKDFKLSLPIRSIRVSSYGKSRRARMLKIRHSAGELEIRAAQFRMALGPERIRSTLFSKIHKNKNGFYFKGNGWGHGIGLCQEGAKGMAQSGKNYKKIVGFYYRGTQIEKWEE